MSNTQIADALVVAETTVKTDVARIVTKLDLRDRAQAVVAAYPSGLIQPGRTTKGDIPGWYVSQNRNLRRYSVLVRVPHSQPPGLCGSVYRSAVTCPAAADWLTTLCGQR